jgi:hypothetical protein
MEDRILTLHPEGKEGVNISKTKYDQIRRAILQSIRDHGEISFKALPGEVEQRITEDFAGSITWYVTTVKLDLEARGEIERIPGKSPQSLRMTSS